MTTLLRLDSAPSLQKYPKVKNPTTPAPKEELKRGDHRFRPHRFRAPFRPFLAGDRPSHALPRREALGPAPSEGSRGSLGRRCRRLAGAGPVRKVMAQGVLVGAGNGFGSIWALSCWFRLRTWEMLGFCSC